MQLLNGKSERIKRILINCSQKFHSLYIQPNRKGGAFLLDRKIEKNLNDIIFYHSIQVKRLMSFLKSQESFKFE